MTDKLHSLVESLKEFLAEEQGDSYNSHSANLYKYNNLKLYMDPKKSNLPHFIIRIGISEAMYSIEQGEKISGGLGADEKIVRRWIMRNLSKMNLGLEWAEANKTEVINVKDFN